MQLVFDYRKEEFRRKFREYDADGNGFVSFEEAAAVLSRELGFGAEQTHSMLAQFDSNHDGKLSYDEFIGFYAKIKDK